MRAKKTASSPRTVYHEPDKFKHISPEKCSECGRSTRYWLNPHVPLCVPCSQKPAQTKRNIHDLFDMQLVRYRLATRPNVLIKWGPWKIKRIRVEKEGRFVVRFTPADEQWAEFHISLSENWSESSFFENTKQRMGLQFDFNFDCEKALAEIQPVESPST